MQNISFEQAMTRLEEITVLIENGNISLDESVKLYEEGVKLTGICETLLDNAQLKLSKFKAGEKNED